MKSQVASDVYGQYQDYKGQDITANFDRTTLGREYNWAQKLIAATRNTPLTSKTSADMFGEKYATAGTKIKEKWMYIPIEELKKPGKIDELKREITEVYRDPKKRAQVFGDVLASTKMPKPPKEFTRLERVAGNLYALNTQDLKVVLDKSFKDMSYDKMVDNIAYAKMLNKKKVFALLSATPKFRAIIEDPNKKEKFIEDYKERLTWIQKEKERRLLNVGGGT